VEYLDTNVILRYLTRDDPRQAERARLFLKQVEAGSSSVTTSEAVIAEAVYVLSSRALYNLPRSDIKTHLTNIISLRGLKLPNKRTYLKALDLYAGTNMDFVDALNVAHMKRSGIETIVSFDRDFDGIAGIHRREP
jgi:predicted nucleic acid-binding protein